jgi:hypothetical protein
MMVRPFLTAPHAGNGFGRFGINGGDIRVEIAGANAGAAVVGSARVFIGCGIGEAVVARLAFSAFFFYFFGGGFFVVHGFPLVKIPECSTEKTVAFSATVFRMAKTLQHFAAGFVIGAVAGHGVGGFFGDAARVRALRGHAAGLHTGHVIADGAISARSVIGIASQISGLIFHVTRRAIADAGHRVVVIHLIHSRDCCTASSGSGSGSGHSADNRSNRPGGGTGDAANNRSTNSAQRGALFGVVVGIVINSVLNIVVSNVCHCYSPF